LGTNDVIPSDSTSEITYQNPDGNTPEASDDSVTNSEVQHLEDVSEDTASTASLEVLMAGENNIVDNSNPAGIPAEGENTYNDREQQMSVSVIGSLIANSMINSDSDTESTSETTSVDSSSEICPTPLKKLCTAAGPVE